MHLVPFYNVFGTMWPGEETQNLQLIEQTPSQLTYQQSICRTIWNDVWLNKMQEIT